MCGIVGAVAERSVSAILLAGLRRLEYRGYDSAGMAVHDGAQINRLRRLGKVEQLAQALESTPLMGSTGIAHTRWATHGKPSEVNAHPHMSRDNLALVHNGIIENHEALREELKAKGIDCTSETDSEVVAHLVTEAYESADCLLDAVRRVTPKLKGAYALAVMHTDEPASLVVAREGSPLVIGCGVDEHFIGSDAVSLLPVTRCFVYLEEGDVAEVKQLEYQVFDAQGQPVERPAQELDYSVDTASKQGHKHYMHKEMVEQARVIDDTLSAALDENGNVSLSAFGAAAGSLFAQTKHIKILACGTSFHAGVVAKYWLESMGGISVDVEIASEYRYRKTVALPGTLLIVISQSGETADVLAALRVAREHPEYVGSLAICNVPSAALVREADAVFLTRAGVEMGVASTKAFTTQLVALALLTAVFASLNTSTQHSRTILKDLAQCGHIIQQVLDLEPELETVAKSFTQKSHTLFLGRGIFYPIALEGALKLKEISYIHAEAYPAGELKHGPLALVDEDMPVVALLPDDELFDKMKSNLEEVSARGGDLLVVTSETVRDRCHFDATHLVVLPPVPSSIAPIIYTIPLQMLSYHVALEKGTDVDQPRNLAKSVTVE